MSAGIAAVYCTQNWSLVPGPWFLVRPWFLVVLGPWSSLVLGPWCDVTLSTERRGRTFMTRDNSGPSNGVAQGLSDQGRPRTKHGTGTRAQAPRTKESSALPPDAEQLDRRRLARDGIRAHRGDAAQPRAAARPRAAGAARHDGGVVLRRALHSR